MKYLFVGCGMFEKYDTIEQAQRRKAYIEKLHFEGYGNKGSYTIWEAKEVQ